MNPINNEMIQMQEKYIKYLEEQLASKRQKYKLETFDEDESIYNETIVNLNEHVNVPSYISFNVYHATLITEFKVIHMDLRFLKSCNRMFTECKQLKSVIWRNSVTNPIDCSYMFHCCDSIENIEISGLSVTNANYMFFINSYENKNKLNIDLEIDFTYCNCMTYFFKINKPIDVLDFSKCKPTQMINTEKIEINVSECSRIIGIEHLISDYSLNFYIKPHSIDELDLSKITDFNMLRLDNKYLKLKIHKCDINAIKVLKLPNILIQNETLSLELPYRDKLETIEFPDIRNCKIHLKIEINSKPSDSALVSYKELLYKNNTFFISRYEYINMRHYDYYREIWDHMMTFLNIQIVE